MKKTKVYSVRLQSLTSISAKCYKATDFNGNEDLIPKSQVFGQDWDVQKSEAYWIAAWILEQKSITYSTKKEGWYNPETNKVTLAFNSDNIEITHHIPERKEPVKAIPDATLTR